MKRQAMKRNRKKLKAGGESVIDQAAIEIAGYHQFTCGGVDMDFIEDAFDLGRRYERGEWPKLKKSKAKCNCDPRQRECCDICTGTAKAKANGTLRDKPDIHKGYSLVEVEEKQPAAVVSIDRALDKPYLHDHADMVNGHFCIARLTGDLPGSQVTEYWAEASDKWCAFGTVYVGEKAAKAKLAEINHGFKRIVRRDSKPFWYRGLQRNGRWTVCYASGRRLRTDLSKREAASFMAEELDSRGRTIKFW